MSLPLPSNPRIAIVRLSALGDVVLVSAAVRALRLSMPEAEITWITSPLAHALLEGMEGVRFEVCDKPHSLTDYRAFYRRFRDLQFDAVLAMQANLRINLLYPALAAPRRIGFDRVRAREGQWLFCNERIPFRDEHLADGFLSFVETLTGKTLQADWALPLDEGDRAWARQQLAVFAAAAPAESPGSWECRKARTVIALHPYASKAERNWLPERYAAVIEQAVARWGCGMVLTGGNAPGEVALCERLAQAAPRNTLNLCGKTSPKQLAAVLDEADVLVAPDTGAVHIARAMDTPVIGLYAVAPPQLTGPYRRQEFCVDHYPDAVRAFLNKEPEALPWNTRVHHPGAMALITVEEVMEQLARILKT